MDQVQAEIEATLAQREPEVEVLLAEVLGGDTLRLFIDHPEGVDARALRARHPRSCRRSASTTRSRSPRRAASGR